MTGSYSGKKGYFLSKLTSLITLTNDSSSYHNVFLRNNQTFHFCLIYSRSWQSWNCEVPWWMAKRWEGRRRQRRQQAQVRASRRDESQSCQSFVIKKPCRYLLPTRCLFLEMPPSAKKKAEKVQKKKEDWHHNLLKVSPIHFFELPLHYISFPSNKSTSSSHLIIHLFSLAWYKNGPSIHVE